MSKEVIVDLTCPSEDAVRFLHETLKANQEDPWYWLHCADRLECSANSLVRSARIAKRKLQTMTLHGELSPYEARVLMRAMQTPVAEMLFAMAIEARLKAFFAAEGRITEALKIGHNLTGLAEELGARVHFESEELAYLQKARLDLELGRFPAPKGEPLRPGVPVPGIGGLTDPIRKRVQAKIERATQVLLRK